MNIFYCSHNTQIAAQSLDDKRVVKMILESAQLLSNSMHYRGLSGPLKETHRNHPCSIAVRNSHWNYIWLVLYFRELLNEYTRRFNKIHSYEKYIQIFVQATLPKIENIDVTFPNCTTFKEETDLVAAYRKYLTWKWDNDKIFPKWTNRQRPTWYKSRLQKLLDN